MSGVTKLLKNFKETLLARLARMSHIFTPPQAVRLEKPTIIYMKISRVRRCDGSDRALRCWNSANNRTHVPNSSIIVH